MSCKKRAATTGKMKIPKKSSGGDCNVILHSIVKKMEKWNNMIFPILWLTIRLIIWLIINNLHQVQKASLPWQCLLLFHWQDPLTIV